MQQSGLTLLDHALILAQHELEAMRRGDVEAAENHFTERGSLMDQAARTLDESAPEDYKIKLIALQSYNKMIYEEGQNLLQSIKKSLLNSRIATRQARAYAKAGYMH